MKLKIIIHIDNDADIMFVIMKISENFIEAQFLLIYKNRKILQELGYQKAIAIKIHKILNYLGYNSGETMCNVNNILPRSMVLPIKLIKRK